MFINSVGEESLYLNLRATPTIVSTGFSTTLVLEVINTGTNKLVNLQAEMDSVVKNCGTCSYDLVSDVSPTSFASLDPGDIATFEWVYTVEGTTDGDNFTFTASLVNGVDTDSAVVSIKIVETALNANVSFETGGLDNDVAIDDSILLFHMEQHQVPSPGYQMFSAEADGASTGLKIDMETKTAGSAFSSFTNNGSSNTITIPAGQWNASVALRSEAVATGIQDQFEDMIFHFEDGDGVDPDNSEGDANRDLETCSDSAVTYDNSASNSGALCSSTSCTVDLNIADQPNMMILVVANDETGAPESLVTSVDEETNTNVGTEVSHQYVSNSQSIYVFRIMDADITNKGGTNTITVNYDVAPTGGGISVHSFYGVDQTAPDDVDTNQKTSESDTISVTSTPIADGSLIFTAFGSDTTESCTGRGSGQTERADFASSSSRHCVTTEIKSTAAADSQRIDTSDDFNRAGISASAYSPAPENDPDWQPNSGPHGSASYYYDGVNECHQSKNNVSNINGNDLDNNNLTTSLWFKTVVPVEQVTSEQMLVFWEGGGTYPSSDYYKISIGEDGTGTILFEHDVGSGAQSSTCRSVNEYDDGLWHHVVAVRTLAADRCDLYITDTAGADEETPITSSPSHSGQFIDADGKWYVASRENSGNFFKGWIDDVMHWNDDALDSTEADLLSHTNYGDTAHQFEVNLDLTDEDGDFVSNLFSDSSYAIEFQDSKAQADTVDAAYTMFNVTMSLPEIQVTSIQRLNFSMAFVPSTSTWEALELDMKLDDDDFITPLLSILQFPTPDNTFPNYLKYDPTDELILYVNNNGEDGIFFIYSGTRVSFVDNNVSFASQIHYVNATIDPPDPEFAVDVDSDSIYIPSGDKAELRFYAEPSNHPCQAKGTTCIGGDPNGMVIPDGQYRMAAWINGYSDQGEDFGRSVVLGYIIVEDL
jgi:hypothetical protein